MLFAKLPFLQPAVARRQFSFITETYAGAKSFEIGRMLALKLWRNDAANRSRKIGTVEVVFEHPPHMQNKAMHWCPDRNSFYEWLVKKPHLHGYDVYQATAMYSNAEGQEFMCGTAIDFKNFLQIPEDKRSQLVVTVPEQGSLGKAFSRAGWGASDKNKSEKMKSFMRDAIAKAAESDVELKVHKKALEDLGFSETDMHGDFIEQVDVPIIQILRPTGPWPQSRGKNAKDFAQLVEITKDDEVSKRVINGMRKAALGSQATNVMYDMSYKNGCLESAFLVQVSALKRTGSDGKPAFDYQIAHFQMGFTENGDARSGSVTAGHKLNLEQYEAIRRYVELAGRKCWKEQASTVLLEGLGQSEDK